MLKQRWEEMSRTGRDWAVVTALTLTPLVLAVVRIFIFGRGDLDTITVLVVNLNLVSFVASSMVAFMPYALLAAAAWFALWPVLNVENFVEHGSEDRPTLRGGRRVTGVAVLTSVGILFGGIFAGAVVLGTGVVLAGAVVVLRKHVLHELLSRKNSESVREATRRTRNAARGFIAYTFTAYALVAIFYVFGIGYPAELVQVEHEQGLSAGYVLSVDDVSLTLAYARGGVRRIPNDSVERRVLCPVGATEFDTVVLGRERTIAQMILETAASSSERSTPVACATPASSITSSVPAS